VSLSCCEAKPAAPVATNTTTPPLTDSIFSPGTGSVLNQFWTLQQLPLTRPEWEHCCNQSSWCLGKTELPRLCCLSLRVLAARLRHRVLVAAKKSWADGPAFTPPPPAVWSSQADQPLSESEVRQKDKAAARQAHSPIYTPSIITTYPTIRIAPSSRRRQLPGSRLCDLALQHDDRKTDEYTPTTN